MVEITAQQFAWNIRYPGADGVLGRTNPALIDDAAGNYIGLDPKDPFRWTKRRTKPSLPSTTFVDGGLERSRAPPTSWELSSRIVTKMRTAPRRRSWNSFPARRSPGMFPTAI